MSRSFIAYSYIVSVKIYKSLSGRFELIFITEPQGVN